jgi:hypothetical protein
MLLTFNDHRTLSEKGFLDAAWGIVDRAALDANKSAPEDIKIVVKEDFDFGQSLFWGKRGERSVSTIACQVRLCQLITSFTGMQGLGNHRRERHFRQRRFSETVSPVILLASC